MAQYPLFMLLSVQAFSEFRDHINLKLDHGEFSIIMAVAGPLFGWAQDIRICHLQLHQYSNMKSITPGLSYFKNMYSAFEKFSHKWSGILRNQKLEMGIMD